MNPCPPLATPVARMSNATWIRWLAAHPGWHAPAHIAAATLITAGVGVACVGVRPVMPGLAAAYEYTLPGGAGAADLGWGTLPGLSAGSPADASTLASLTVTPLGVYVTAWANLVPQQMDRVRPELLTAVGREVGAIDLPSPPDTSVPEPAGLLVLAVAVLSAVWVRCLSRQCEKRRLNGTAILSSRATSKHGVTHA